MARALALSESNILQRVLFALMYAGQGIPYGLLIIALPAFLAGQGLTAAQSGAYIGVVMLPWSFKLVLGPLMDRYTYLPMGRRRPWLIAAQLGMVASLCALALIAEPLASFTTFTAGVFCLNACVVFQDIAVDSLAIDLAPPDQQGLLNGFMTGGRTLGLAAAAAGAGWSLSAVGVPATMLIFAAVLSALLVVSVVVRERPGERLLPWTSGEAQLTPEDLVSSLSGIGRALWAALRQPASIAVALLIFVFNAAKGVVVALLPLLVVQRLGWADGDYANLMASAGLVTGLLSLVLLGPLVDRVGRLPVFGAGFCLLGAAALVLGLLPGLWSGPVLIPLFIGAYLLAQATVSIAFFATAMLLCDVRIAATQYGLYMAVSNLGMSMGATVYGIVGTELSEALLLILVGITLLIAAFALTRLTLPAPHSSSQPEAP